MKEQACQFGEQGRLNGIVTLPENNHKPQATVILVTAGLTGKTGPFRLYTRLARKAAEKGFATLRFDLGGIGNSGQIHLGLPLKLRTKLDIKAALDYMEVTYQSSNFVLGGLCSGAEDSFRFAEEDARVSGVILLDGHAYITKGWWINHVSTIKFWVECCRGLFKKFKPSKQSLDESNLEGDQGGLIDYQQMDIEESTGILKKLIARNTKLHYLFTRGLDNRFNHESQFAKMYPDIDLKDLVTISYLPQIAHIQVFEEDRELIAKIVSNWLSQSFSVS